MKYDRKVIFAVANRLAKTMSRSEALKTAWALSKGQQAAVVGVTAGKRQQALEHLTRYAAADTDITVKGKDMAVYAGAQGSGCYMVGYLSRQAAAIVRLIQKVGQAVKIRLQAVVGGFGEGIRYGLRLCITL